MTRFSLVAGAFAAATLALAAVPAAAQNLVNNPSFEAPVLAPGGITQDTIPGGWTGQPFGGFGYGVSYEDNVRLLTPNGTQWGYTNNQAGFGSLAQQTSKTVIAGETYTLTAEVGRRTDTGQSTTEIQLWAGGTVTNGVVAGGTMVASQPVVQSSGNFVPATLTWVGTAPTAGQLLTVRLNASAAVGQVNWDNVSLTAVPPPVPTLSEWAMILIGLMLAGTAAMVLQRRKLEA